MTITFDNHLMTALFTFCRRSYGRLLFRGEVRGMGVGGGSWGGEAGLSLPTVVPGKI